MALNAKKRATSTTRKGSAKSVSSSNADSKQIVLEIKGLASYNSARTQKEWYEYVVQNANPRVTALIKQLRGNYYKEVGGKPVIVHFAEIANGHGGLNTIGRLSTAVGKDGKTFVNVDVEMNAAKREYNQLMSLPKLSPIQKKRLEELHNEGNFIV